MGLLDAIERYDPDRGIKFESFAQLRIRGAMVDALRSLDWVPRSVRQNAREIEQAESSLRTKLGRAPSEEEVADDLDLGVADLRQNLLDIHNSQIYSFDAPQLGRGPGDPGTGIALLDVVPSRVAGPQQQLEAGASAADLKTILSSAIVGLPEPEQFVLACRYREDLKFREIGEVMGLSESRVSQLHIRALVGLRAAVGVDHTGELQLAHS